MSTDSLFIRLSGASDWDIAFIVAAFSLPSQLILNRVFGKGGVGAVVPCTSEADVACGQPCLV